MQSIEIKTKMGVVEVTPEVIKINKDPDTFTITYDRGLRYPVVGMALIKYANPLGVNFQRLHNLYSHSLEYFFIDINGKRIILDKDIKEYEVDPEISKGFDYTVHNLFKNATN